MCGSRRSLLRTLGSITAVSLAGCQTESDDTEPTETEPETSTATSTERTATPTPARSSLSLSASVLAQQSPESPARLQVSMRNEGSRTVSPRWGPALLFTDNGPPESSKLAWPDALALHPKARGAYVTGLPDEPSEGCWRVPADAGDTQWSILETRSLAPGEQVSDEYELYTRGTGPCLPAGTYRFEDLGYFPPGRDVPMITRLVVDVDRQQTVSARASLSFPDPSFDDE